MSKEVEEYFKEWCGTREVESIIEMDGPWTLEKQFAQFCIEKERERIQADVRNRLTPIVCYVEGDENQRVVFKGLAEDSIEYLKNIGKK